MKAAKIIKKNIRMLLRSRISTLVLTVGPLLVILLVGMSFSTNTFNLHLGVYSEGYSDLSNDFIDKLANESFAISRYDTEDLCVQAVQEGQTHACIVFPPNMSIENDQPNVINFHVDQSKINLVYLVMSTVSTSFGEKSTEISRGLTNEIVLTLFDTSRELKNSKSLVEDVRSINDQYKKISKESESSLDDLDLSSSEVTVNVNDIRAELDGLRDDALVLVDEGLETVEDLEPHVDGNGTNDLEDLEDTLNSMNSTLTSGHNATASEIQVLATDLAEEVNDLQTKLEDAESANKDVVNKLSMLQDLSSDLESSANSLDLKISAMISEIDTIQVTNTENIVSPFSTKITKIAQSESNLGFLFPSLMVMLIMFIGLLLPSMLIIMEKNSRAYFRTFTTPTTHWLFVVATYLTSMILIFVQLAIILGVSKFYFNVDIQSGIMLVLLALTIIMTVFILAGMLIGYIFNSEEMAMLAAVSIGTLFLLTSGIIFPIESMPTYISEKAQYNPVVMGSDLFKRTLLFDTELSSISTPLFILLGFSAVLLLIIFLIKKAENINIVLKKPTLRKNAMLEHFEFGDRKAQTLPEFIVSLQNLGEEKFDALHKQNVVKEWINQVYKDKALAAKVEKCKTQKETVELLIQHLKSKQ